MVQVQRGSAVELVACVAIDAFGGALAVSLMATLTVLSATGGRRPCPPRPGAAAAGEQGGVDADVPPPLPHPATAQTPSSRRAQCLPSAACSIRLPPRSATPTGCAPSRSGAAGTRSSTSPSPSVAERRHGSATP